MLRSISLLLICTTATAAQADPTCIVKSDHGAAKVAVKVPERKQRFVVGVSDARIVADVHRAKAGYVPVQVDGTLRFTGEAVRLPLRLDGPTEGYDGVTRFHGHASLQIVNARRGKDDSWLFDVAFAEDRTNAVILSASFPCEALELRAGPTERDKRDWAMSSFGLPSGDDKTRWVPKAGRLVLRAPRPGDMKITNQEVTIEMDHPDLFILARFRRDGSRFLVGREISPGAYVVGWVNADALAPWAPPETAASAEDDQQNGEEGGVAGAVGGVIAGAPPPPPPAPQIVELVLPEGAAVRAARKGTTWARIGKAGRYDAVRLTDGAHVLVNLPGVQSPGAMVYFVDSPSR